MVPDLNELHEKYSEQGLVIVGVTNESAALVEKSLSSTGAQYPIAMVKGGSADDAYGVNGFPTVVLVGPEGNVLSRERHPEAAIVEALKRAVLIPKLEGRQYSSINKAIEKKDLGKAWKSIASMLEKNASDEQLIAAKEAIESSFKNRFDGAIAAAGKGNYGSAVDSLEKIVDLYNGYPRVAEAKAKAKAIGKDPEAKDDLKAWSMLKKAKKEMAKGKKASREKGRQICEKIMKSYPDTPTAEKARAIVRSS